MELKQTRNQYEDRTLAWTLADLDAGQSAEIDCIECEYPSRCDRLAAYGLVRGQTVTLVQRKPAFVIRVDETELALDESIARCVRVFKHSVTARRERINNRIEE
jgi:Fe2+ transport system protein FeoA